MHSSGENSRKRKDNSDKRGEYRKFDEFSSQMRDSVIKSYARKVIAHVAVNDGSCKRGFVKNLVDMAAEVVPALKITRDDINNKVRRIRDPPEQQQQQQQQQEEVSPAIPYHAIVCPTLSTDSDSSISADLISERTSAENPLDILANQAAVMLESTSRCILSTQLTLPNRCLYEGCNAPLNLVPEHCSRCLRLVH